MNVHLKAPSILLDPVVARRGVPSFKIDGTRHRYTFFTYRLLRSLTGGRQIASSIGWATFETFRSAGGWRQGLSRLSPTFPGDFPGFHLWPRWGNFVFFRGEFEITPNSKLSPRCRRRRRRGRKGRTRRGCFLTRWAVQTSRSGARGLRRRLSSFSATNHLRKKVNLKMLFSSRHRLGNDTLMSQ